ncbi:hypothetical protein BST61_g85 [Cercospora zeina]
MEQSINVGDKGKGKATDDSPPRTPQPYHRGAFGGGSSGRSARSIPPTSAGNSRDQGNSPTPVRIVSPPKHQRKSLESAFGAMGISGARLHSTFSSGLPGGFPNWSTMLRADGGLSPIQLEASPDTKAYLLVRSDSYWRKPERIIVDEAAKKEQKPDRIRQRREIVNHAAALMEMTNVVVNEGKRFTEDLIKECHKILSHAGIYRSKPGRDEVAAGNLNFVVPRRVASSMASFVADLNSSLRQAELQKALDPFMIAANACGDFVNIHTFFDGNGRLCRLILSTIMLKYAGTVVAIGETAGERKEYLEISKRRSERFEGNVKLAGLILKQSIPALGSLKTRLEAARGR